MQDMVAESLALETPSVNELPGSTCSASQKEKFPPGHTGADELCDELWGHQHQPQQVSYAATAPQADPHLLQQQELPAGAEGDVDVSLLEHHLQPHEGVNQLLPPACNAMLGRDATSDHRQHVLGFFSQALHGAPQEAHADFCHHHHHNALQQQAAYNDQTVGCNSEHLPPQAVTQSDTHLLMEAHTPDHHHLPYDQYQPQDNHHNSLPRHQSLSDMAWPDDIGMT